ncbi:MAG: bifunctional serine/threonine-protein kinase/formylglycine-generating enzyme family protein [Planctomycetota bacterium]|jgi:serine/threonine protein kinase/formylglycine-generating enzyme required for sulfatase activity
MRQLEDAMDVFLASCDGAAEPPQDLDEGVSELLRPMLEETADSEPEVSDHLGGSGTARGTMLGDFRIEEEIGRGGMGVVYRATQMSLGRAVALKVLPAHLTLQPSAIARFRREAQAMATMEHPGIVRIFAVGEQGNTNYFAMALVDGCPLSTIVARLHGQDLGELSGRSVGEAVIAETKTDESVLDQQWRRGYVQTVVELIIQVAEALEHAHRAGIIHRDVKPSNILIRVDGTAVLTDFGLAQDRGLPSMTMTGDFAGTPYYVSPEQALAKRVPLDHRADVFSLGSTLYELLTLQRPFPGDTSHEVLNKILVKEPPGPDKLNPYLAPDLAAIVLKALEKDPDRRYLSAASLAEDLRAFLEYRPVQARRVSTGRRLLRWVRREPLKALVALLLILSAPLLVTLGSYMAEVERLASAEREALRQYDQLSNIVHLEKARAATVGLRPAQPEQLPAFRAWRREQAEPLVARLPKLREALAEIRQRVSADNAVSAQPQFAKAEDEFVFQNLSRLIHELEDFETGLMHRMVGQEDWASRVHELSITRHQDLWAKARDAIRKANGTTASTLYQGQPPLDLKPQIGLVPIGMNPATRLWEFYHLRSAGPDPINARIPNPSDYDSKGRLRVGKDTGIVFVLVPGGTFWMGAQSASEEQPNHDPDAEDNEGPVHQVELEPFFLARHELTQAQWSRLSWGEQPSNAAGQVSPACPVESVSWTRCQDLLDLHGLLLPTEAQWEYACRAGTDTPWWTGRERQSLADSGPAANLADRTARQAGLRWSEIAKWPRYRDGHAMYAEVDRLRANPWGFHHIHGNVFEWCRDRYGSYQLPFAKVDGLRQVPPTAANRISRGGSFNFQAGAARSANRNFVTPSAQFNVLGVRPSRALQR